MKKLLFVCAAVLLSFNGMWSRSLTADQALALVQRQAQKAMGPTSGLQLAYTIPSEKNGANALYVFASSDRFAVVAADDAVDQLLLGYSDGAFDASNLPPAFDWYLRASAAAIDGQIAMGARAPRAATERAAISPLMATKWDQGNPYKLQCPVVLDQTSVTGCVATAMAQVANYHQWPLTGTGSNSYQFIVNGTTYTESMDFSTVTFDWANMRNEYRTSSTAAQQNAVAQLMHACGVACNMLYTPRESSSNYYKASNGLVNYLNYDKSMRLLNASWFTLDEWNDLIYSELSAGRPVLYSGADIAGAGHAFVCDGYAANDMFHINWGWGGASDGYYILPDLYPPTMGTGGGSGGSGFNFGQQAIVNVKPYDGGDYILVMGMNETLRTNAQSYNRSNNETVTFTGGIINNSLIAAQVVIGLHLVGNGVDTYMPYVMGNLKPGTYVPQLEIPSSNFPKGEYDVYPVYINGTSGPWQPVYYDKRHSPNGVRLNVTETTVTVVDTGSHISATQKSIKAAEGDDDAPIISGNYYNVTYDITTDGPWTGSLQVIVYDDASQTQFAYNYSTRSDGTLGTGVSQYMVIPEAGTTRATFSLPIPSTLAAGTYQIALSYYDPAADAKYVISEPYEIVVSKIEVSGSATLTSVTGATVYYNSPPSLSIADASITFSMAVTSAPWHEKFYVTYWEPTLNGTKISLSSICFGPEKWAIVEEANGNYALSFDASFDGCEYGKTYAISLHSLKTGDFVRVGDVDTGNKFFYYTLNNDVTITDATAYANDTDIDDVDITYVRNFNNTEWQPLYVPFDMDVADLDDKADVAKLEGVIMRDTDNNGSIDYTVVTFTTVTSGTISANVPYLIKAHATGPTSFVVEGTTLNAAADNYVHCSTTSHDFYLRGVYELKRGLDTANEYIMGGGTFYHTTGGVKPMRFYLQKAARPGYGSHAPQRSAGSADDVIYVEVDGVQTDALLHIEAATCDDDIIYDMQGRRVINPAPGIYVRNGKKVIIK